MLRRTGDHAILDRVSFLQSKNAHCLHAHIVIRRKLFHRDVRHIRHRARQHLGSAPVRVTHADQRNLDLLERSIVIKRNAPKLLYAQHINDLDDRVNFLARVPICLKPHLRFQQLNLKRKLRLLRSLLFPLFLCGGFLRSRSSGFVGRLLCSRSKSAATTNHNRANKTCVSQTCHVESLGRTAPIVKRVSPSFPRSHQS
jgi:hypothetical protein